MKNIDKIIFLPYHARQMIQTYRKTIFTDTKFVIRTYERAKSQISKTTKYLNNAWCSPKFYATRVIHKNNNAKRISVTATLVHQYANKTLIITIIYLLESFLFSGAITLDLTSTCTHLENIFSDKRHANSLSALIFWTNQIKYDMPQKATHNPFLTLPHCHLNNTNNLKVRYKNQQ